MPVHLRWELYPVGQKKVHSSGGSYLESLNWRTKRRKKSLFSELRFIADEILFFRMYYRHKRGYWFSVYPFHLGIFLLFVWLVLLFAGAVMSVAGLTTVGIDGNLSGRILFYLTLVSGSVGFMFAIIGCTGLLIRRYIDDDLKLYTSPKEYFTLYFMLLTFLSGIFAWLFFDFSFDTIRGFMMSLVSFTPVQTMNPATYINILLICLFLLYAPFTRMMHFLAKYFSFHSVRWDDVPNLSGSKIRKKVEKQLNFVLTWSASQVPKGKKWSEVVSGHEKIAENEADR
jgi:nitrate reductase gamma subunit